jgi:hypothetical protein
MSVQDLQNDPLSFVGPASLSGKVGASQGEGAVGVNLADLLRCGGLTRNRRVTHG